MVVDHCELEEAVRMQATDTVIDTGNGNISQPISEIVLSKELRLMIEMSSTICV